MANVSSILGLNARNHLFQAKYNRPVGKKIADSKLATKTFLKKHKILTPALLGVFSDFRDVPKFDWGTLTDNFVVKPAEGYAGAGIIIIKKRISGDEFITMSRQKIGIDDLKLHVLDILEGHYSIHSLPGTAFIEERILIHPAFRRYAYQGTPDVRVIVFNKVPMMAMLRLPTAESQGKANVHQGAIGTGINLLTGRTTWGVCWDKPVRLVPGKNLKLSGLQIPFWEQILLTAVKIQQSLKNLGYLAVDFVVDELRGPMVLELTARPGLMIQIANMGGLRRRLDRIEGIEIDGPEKGVRIAKDLFGTRPKSLKREELKIFETVELLDRNKKRIEIEAKIDTGAFRTSIDRDLAKKLGLLKKSNVLWTTHYESSLGKENRPVIGLTLWLGGKKLITTASVARRKDLRKKIIIGRRDLKGYVIKA
jgi:alpha-L-glutamate ligase-like protein